MSRKPFSTIDFETESIEARPAYPPKPVGVALKYGRFKKYLAWGHETGNNCTKKQAITELKDLYRDTIPIFHNSAFDLDVAETHLGLKLPDEFEDTLILAYLANPREETLSLKPLSEKYLGIPPEEQALLKDWIITNVPEVKRKKSQWGAYICRAPVSIVGPYAKQDVNMTWNMFLHLRKEISARNMDVAYARERKLIPIKLKMERTGIFTNLRKLKRDAKIVERALTDIEVSILKKLKVPKSEWEEFKFSGKNFAESLLRSKMVDTLPKTDKGNYSVKISILPEYCKDKRLLSMLSIRSVLTKYHNTFYLPWIDIAQQTGGSIHPTFNTVRSTDEYTNKGGVGTRTGRFSSSGPNFQNVPADVESSKNREVLLQVQSFLLKKYNLKFIGMRDYLIPEKGYVFLGRDYYQQELRILAHFEDGKMLLMYKNNPAIDFHASGRDLIEEQMSMSFSRKSIKTTIFALIYGLGVVKLAAGMEVDVETAKKLKNAILQIFPGIKALSKKLKELADHNAPLVTWGGREYFCEEPKVVKINGVNKRITFEYKMLNLLIQGSAADCTKEAMINVDEHCGPSFKSILQVHDELLGSAPKENAAREMKRMKEAMEAVKFDVAMLTDGKMSNISWARMKECD